MVKGKRSPARRREKGSKEMSKVSVARGWPTVLRKTHAADLVRHAGGWRRRGVGMDRRADR